MSGKRRLPRFDGHGRVRCSACERYLDPGEFGYPPSLKGRPTAYCHGCQRGIDRMRWRGERRERGNRRRSALQRREYCEGRRSRLATVQGAILTLRRRGFTKAEIVKLTDSSFGNLLKWEAGEAIPTRGIVRRFLVVLAETRHFPLGEPVYRRRLPHPELAGLLERIGPKVSAIPVRSRWNSGATAGSSRGSRDAG